MASSGAATVLADRIQGCIVGSLTADAAGMPVHWVYGKDAMAKVLKDTNGLPEFKAESSNPFYRLPTGRQSGYGDQAIVMLRHCREVAKASRQAPGGRAPELGRDAYAAAVTKHFGPGSEYDPTATTEYHVDGTPSGKTKRYEAHKESKWPISGPWMHHAIKEFNAAVARGDPWPQGAKDDKQADAAAKIAPVVCLFAGHVARARAAGNARGVELELRAAVDDATRTTQDDDVTVSSARLVSRVILECLLGARPRDAVRLALVHMRDASLPGRLASDEECAAAVELATSPAMLARSHQEVVDELGNTCKLMNSMQTPLHAAAIAAEDSASSEAAFLDAVRQTLAARGCNCSRLCIAGAVLGAALGRDAVPDAWVSKTTEGADIVDAARVLAEFAAVQDRA